jgi:hypothetical protein
MILFTQNKQAIWNFDDVSRLHLTSQGNAVVLVSKNGAGGEMGKYRSREQAVFVMGMLISAVESDERSFCFPTEQELEHAKQHGSSGGGSRHGGS